MGPKNATQPSSAPLLDKKGSKFIQEICRMFIFLGRAIDSTLICPINAITSQSTNLTKDTTRQTQQLLDDIATQEEDIFIYSNSDMRLADHSDASYLSEPKARSRAGGHFFLSKKAKITPKTAQFSKFTIYSNTL